MMSGWRGRRKGARKQSSSIPFTDARGIFPTETEAKSAEPEDTAFHILAHSTRSCDPRGRANRRNVGRRMDLQSRIRSGTLSPPF